MQELVVFIPRQKDRPGRRAIQKSYAFSERIVDRIAQPSGPSHHRAQAVQFRINRIIRIPADRPQILFILLNKENIELVNRPFLTPFRKFRHIFFEVQYTYNRSLTAVIRPQLIYIGIENFIEGGIRLFTRSRPRLSGKYFPDSLQVHGFTQHFALEQIALVFGFFPVQIAVNYAFFGAVSDNTSGFLIPASRKNRIGSRKFRLAAVEIYTQVDTFFQTFPRKVITQNRSNRFFHNYPFYNFTL